MKKNENKWKTNLNFNNAKKPLSDIRIALQLIREDYKKKHKELMRLQKGSDDNTNM